MCICAHSFRALGTVLGVAPWEQSTFYLERPVSGLTVYLLGELADQREGFRLSLPSRPPVSATHA